MTLAQSLVAYHFNSIKFGQICKQYAKERKVSQPAMAAATGLSYDTVGNIYAGRVQKIPYEYVLKICAVLEIPLMAITMIMLKDEDVDFLDKVLLYNTADDAIVPVEDAVPTLVPAETPETVIATAANVTAAMPVIEEACGVPVENIHSGYTDDELRTIINKVSASYDMHIQDLKDVHQREQEASAKHCEQLYNLAMSLASNGLP